MARKLIVVPGSELRLPRVEAVLIAFSEATLVEKQAGRRTSSPLSDNIVRHLQGATEYSIENRSHQPFNGVLVEIVNRQYQGGVCECTRDPRRGLAPEDRIFCGCPWPGDHMREAWNSGTDKFGVDRFTLQPRGSEPDSLIEAHAPDYGALLVALTSLTLRDRAGREEDDDPAAPPRTRTRTLRLRRGEVAWLGPHAHDLDNLSPHQASFLMIAFWGR